MARRCQGRIEVAVTRLSDLRFRRPIVSKRASRTLVHAPPDVTPVLGGLRAAVARVERNGPARQAENVEQDRYDAIVSRARGVRLGELGIFQMFPHSVYVEILGLLVRIR